MTYCKECGHKLGFLEHAADGLCNGCRQRLAHEQEEKAHAAAIAPYTSAELPVITVTDAIMKKGETAVSNSDAAQGDQNGQPGLFGSESRRLDPSPDKGGGLSRTISRGSIARPHRQT